MNLGGYAATFNRSALIGATLPFVEIIRPGAFRRTLKESKRIALIHHHDWRTLLASTANGTLKLQEDTHGLRFDAELPDTTAARDLHELVRRGDLDGMSFSFSPRGHTGEFWKDDADGGVTRELLDVDLIEITLTAIPAYRGTSVNVGKGRSSKRRRRKVQGKHNHLNARRRMVQKLARR